MSSKNYELRNVKMTYTGWRKYQRVGGLYYTEFRRLFYEHLVSRGSLYCRWDLRSHNWQVPSCSVVAYLHAPTADFFYIYSFRNLQKNTSLLTFCKTIPMAPIWNGGRDFTRRQVLQYVFKNHNFFIRTRMRIKFIWKLYLSSRTITS
jgi:hypothetical protein